jgi:hypothetical protein
MFKIIETGSWNQLESQGVAHLLPYRKSGGVSPSDGRGFFRKTAASERFLHEIASFRLGDGDIPVHVNAIGASEWYGPNRKGDAFREQTCRDWHHTFVTEGRNYEHHRNRDPEISYGKIASSCYNESMKRIELLVISNGTESAARRNGGLVLPDEFLTGLEKNAALPVSMGCTIRHDICSICGNRARTRSEYCDATTCRDPKTGEYFPGCRHGLMKIAGDGRQVYVDNIEPHFFDLSYVRVPADRTAYGVRADYLARSPGKSASCDPLPPPESRFGVTVPPGGNMRYRTEMCGILEKLAVYENRCRTSPDERCLAYGLRAVSQNPLLGCKLAGMLPESRMSGVRRLAEAGILLSPENFATAFGFGKTAAQAIRSGAGSLYTEAFRRYGTDRRDTLGNLLAAFDGPFDGKSASLRFPDAFLAESVLSESRLAAAVSRGIVMSGGPLCKAASQSVASEPCEPADAYALLQTAALCRFPEMQRAFGIKVAVWHPWSA